jgi:isopentenyldiphosphate isomerase
LSHGRQFLRWPARGAHRAASDAEQIAWVDEQDNLLGTLVRSDLRERGLIGRGTYIMLFNSAGELCVHRRTLSKAIYPGYWDVAAGGMVLADETYKPNRRPGAGRRVGRERVELTAHDIFSSRTPAIACGVRRFRRCGTGR